MAELQLAYIPELTYIQMQGLGQARTHGRYPYRSSPVRLSLTLRSCSVSTYVFGSFWYLWFFWSFFYVVFFLFDLCECFICPRFLLARFQPRRFIRPWSYLALRIFLPWLFFRFNYLVRFTVFSCLERLWSYVSSFDSCFFWFASLDCSASTYLKMHHSLISASRHLKMAQLPS